MPDHKHIADRIGELTLSYVEMINTAIKSGNIGEVFAAFNAMKEANAALDTARKGLGAAFEKFNKQVLPEFLDTHEMDLVRVPELGRSFYVNTQYSASITDSEAAMDWLRDNGGDELIKPTVNAGTLKSFVLSKIEEEGVEPPEDVIKLSSYRQIGSSKYTPKN